MESSFVWSLRPGRKRERLYHIRMNFGGVVRARPMCCISTSFYQKAFWEQNPCVLTDTTRGKKSFNRKTIVLPSLVFATVPAPLLPNGRAFTSTPYWFLSSHYGRLLFRHVLLRVTLLLTMKSTVEMKIFEGFPQFRRTGKSLPIARRCDSESK
ncbi:unnamed protein product [Amoebophrya sp. A120]|nr:unnamed protein product [Amoebophrya sp. A120]|eukprot:GSA120T00004621001.1